MDNSLPEKKKSTGYVKKKELLLVIVIFFAVSSPYLVLFLISNFRPGHTESSRKYRDSLKLDLQVCIREYIQSNEKFPQDVLDESGKPIASWRLHFPFSGKAATVSINPTEPWTSDAYNIYTQWNENLFCFDNRTNTNIVAIKGNDTYYDVGGIIDHKMIILVEVSNFEKHWMEPGDITIAELKNIMDGQSKVKLGTDSDYFMVMLTNGSLIKLKKETPFEELRPFLTFKESQNADFQSFFKKYRY